MSAAENISAIVLAAGKSGRMGQNKLLMDIGGRPMLLKTLEPVGSVGFGERILVTARRTAAALDIPDGFKTVYNDSPDEGQSLSIRLGVKAASCGYYMFFLGDMPFLDADTVNLIIGAVDGGKIIVPYADGKPRNPVIFPKSLRVELLALRGDTGGRGVIAANRSSCKIVRLENAEPFRDVDTVEDYLKL